MSIWTHIAGTIRIDDMSNIFDSLKKKDLSKIFIRDTYYHSNPNGNLPSGSEGSIDVEFVERPEDKGTEYMKTIVFFGDLRDYDNNDCKEVKEWWYSIPRKLGKDCLIRQAILQVKPEDSEMFILTEEDMNLYKEEDYK